MVQTLPDLSVKYLARQIGHACELAQKSGTQTGEMQEELKDDLQSLPDHLQREILHSVDQITFDYIRSLLVFEMDQTAFTFFRSYTISNP